MISDACGMHVTLVTVALYEYTVQRKPHGATQQLQRGPTLQEPPAETVRKGTKRSLECRLAPRLRFYSHLVFLTCCTGRHRKVRCV